MDINRLLNNNYGLLEHNELPFVNSGQNLRKFWPYGSCSVASVVLAVCYS